MATWKRIDPEPVTTERRVRVTDGEREGWADVRWLNGMCKLARRVYREEPAGFESWGEPIVDEIVLDGNPTFA